MCPAPAARVSSLQPREEIQGFARSLGPQGSHQMQGRPHRGGAGERPLLALCLDSDKGIFKFLEILMVSRQSYFHPRTNHLFPWSSAHVSRRKMRSEGRMVLPVCGPRRLGGPFLRQRQDSYPPAAQPAPLRGSAGGDTPTVSAPGPATKEFSHQDPVYSSLASDRN